MKALLLMLAAGTAQCGPHDQLLSYLAQQYQEKPLAHASLSHGAYMLELTVADSGTFTILATGPDGVTCIITAGDGWTVTGKVGRGI